MLPARSKVHDVVLALVVERNGYGYDIGQRFIRRYGGFFSRRVQTAYESLDRLQEEGLLDAYDAPRNETDRWRKRSYKANEHGVAAHRGWMAAAYIPADADRELWIRMLATRPGDHGTLLALFDRYEQAILKMRRRELTDPLCDALLDRLAVEEHERWLQSRLAWLERSRELVETGVPHVWGAR